MTQALALAEIDGLRLADALRAGIYRLFLNSEHINKINVFPVPDGDTGTNMAMTLAAVLNALNREPLAHAGQLLLRVADAAIDGARGNSGAILSQFLTGLGDGAGHLARLTVSDFCSAARSGAAYARNALIQPREGTLLTVLAAFAQQLERVTAELQQPEFRGAFLGTIQGVRDSLAGTRGQLEELRAANVVDAGALGFVEMLEGMTHYFDTGEVGELVAAAHIEDEQMAVGEASPGEHRFCTECLIVGEALEARRIRERLSTMGSSLVVGGSQRKVRVHIHTDEPERVFSLAMQFGRVSGEKADDMQKQAAAAHHARGRRVAIVIDSAADLPDSLLERLELHVVPVRVHFGNRSYLDKVSLSAEEFYREIERGAEHPKTSQPPPGDFRRMYEFLASHFEGVVSISLSARVSGTYNAAVTAAQRIAGGRVQVIDSLNASLGQGLVAWAAGEAALAGGSPVDVAAAARAALSHSRTFALLARLDYMVRGGRVPPIVKNIAELLGLSIVLTSRPDGAVRPGTVLWGRHRLRSRFARLIRRRMRADSRYRVLVGHANAESEARALLAEIVQGAGNVETSEIATLGPALGVHGGPGMLVVGLQQLPRG